MLLRNPSTFECWAKEATRASGKRHKAWWMFLIWSKNSVRLHTFQATKKTEPRTDASRPCGALSASAATACLLPRTPACRCSSTQPPAAAGRRPPPISSNQFEHRNRKLIHLLIHSLTPTRFHHEQLTGTAVRRSPEGDFGVQQ